MAEATYQIKAVKKKKTTRKQHSLKMQRLYWGLLSFKRSTLFNFSQDPSFFYL